MRVHALKLQQSFVLLSPYKIVGEPNIFHLYSETSYPPPCSVILDKALLNWLGQKYAVCVKHRFFLQCHLVSEAQVLQVLKHHFA